jgi:hypothetical protein
LPGDLGRPILNAQGPALGPASIPVDPERQRLAQETEAARTSHLFATTATREQIAAPTATPGATEERTAPPTGRTDTPSVDPESLLNMQDRKSAFLNGPTDRKTVSPDRLANPASRYVVQAGAVIPAALVTGIRSDLPGQVTAQATENVYDQLMFSLRLERAECAFLSGNYDEAEELISELLARGASTIDKAAAYRLKISLHVMRSENPEGVESALECLRLFGIEIPAHPTREQVAAEYEKVWNNLGERPIESLIDLPLMTDPEMKAAIDLLSALSSPAYFTDLDLYRLHFCHMVNLSMEYGATGASGHAYSGFAISTAIALESSPATSSRSTSS